MLIAVSTEGDNVSAHFGRCPAFTIAEIQDNEVKKSEKILNPGHHPGFLPQFLKEKGVNCIVAGGMGQKALQLFAQEGIQVITGVTGTVSDVLKDLADGKVESGESLCKPGAGKGYGLDKTECDHPEGSDHSKEGC